MVYINISSNGEIEKAISLQYLNVSRYCMVVALLWISFGSLLKGKIFQKALDVFYVVSVGSTPIPSSVCIGRVHPLHRKKGDSERSKETALIVGGSGVGAK